MDRPEVKAAPPNSAQRSWAVLVLSSALFGLYHAANLFARCLLAGLLLGAAAGGAYVAFRFVLSLAGV